MVAEQDDGLRWFPILSPCDTPWPSNGIIAEAETNKEMVITGEVDLNELHINREKGAATTFKDRARRSTGGYTDVRL